MPSLLPASSPSGRIVHLTAAALLMAACVAIAQPPPAYVISTIAGAYSSGDGGRATDALLWFPQSMVRDSGGRVYFCDFSNGRVRVLAPDGTISTLFRISANDITLDPSGRVVIATGTTVLRIVSATESVRIAGNGLFAFSGDGGQATAAAMNPSGIAYGKDGSLYIADQNANRVRKVTPDGVIRTIAGDGTAGFTGDGGPAASARLNRPFRLAVDDDGNLYIGENFSNGRIRKIDPAGNITTVAGNGVCCSPEANQIALQTPVGLPNGLAVRGRQVHWSDAFSGSVFRLVDGAVRRIAGSGTSGFAGDGGLATSARLSGPYGLALAEDGSFWVADSGNHRIRQVGPDGVIRTTAGRSHFEGDGGPALRALLFGPQGAAVDDRGNLFIADSSNNRIRRVSPDGVITTYAGTGEFGSGGDGGPATAAQLNSPRRVLFDPDGNLLVLDSNNRRVRRIAPSGVITTVAGNGQFGNLGDGGPAVSAQFGFPAGIAVDRNKNIYVADSSNHRVRVIRADGTIQPFAGTSTQGFTGDGGLATAARLAFPQDVAVDTEGNVYIADNSNSRVRKVTPGGTISTLAGNGQFGVPTDGQPGPSQPIGSPLSIAADRGGNVIIVSNSGRIHLINGAGAIFTIAGGGTLPDTPPENAVATSTGLSSPQGLFTDAAGDIYTTELFFHRVRKLVRNTASRLEITGGNNQTGLPNRPLADALRVQVVGRAGLGVPNVGITFTVTQGAARLSVANTLTGPDGIAGVSLTLGAAEGTVTITATATGLPTVTFRATTVAPTVAVAPVLISAETGSGGVHSVSANALVTLTGEGFAPATVAAASADFAEGRPPVNLGNTCVTFAGARAFLLNVSPTQIRAVVPAVTPGEIEVIVIANCGGANELRSNAITVTAAAASPNWLYHVRRPEGGSPVLATDDAGRLIGPPGIVAGQTFVLAKPGQVVTVLGTGFGDTNPPISPGTASSGQLPLAAEVELSLGGAVVAAESIQYVGAAPGVPGTYQVTFRVPEQTAEGNHALVLRIGDFRTPDDGFLAVQP